MACDVGASGCGKSVDMRAEVPETALGPPYWGHTQKEKRGNRERGTVREQDENQQSAGPEAEEKCPEGRGSQIKATRHLPKRPPEVSSHLIRSSGGLLKPDGQRNEGEDSG